MHYTVLQNQAHSVNLSTGSLVSIKALRVLQGLLSTIPSFWTADDVNLVVDLYLLHDVVTETLVMANLVKAVAKRVPSSVLIPTLCDTWKRLKESSATTSFGAFFLLVKKTIHAAPRAELLHRLRALFSLFLDGFVVQSNEETSDAEVRNRLFLFYPSVTQRPFVILGRTRDNLRIPGVGGQAQRNNFQTLLPKTVRLGIHARIRYENAIPSDFPETHTWIPRKDERKRAVFCRVYTALLDYFKALMTPYMSFMIQAFTDLLESFSESEEPDPELWSSLVHVLGKSFEVDEAGTIQTSSIPP